MLENNFIAFIPNESGELLLDSNVVIFNDYPSVYLDKYVYDVFYVDTEVDETNDEDIKVKNTKKSKSKKKSKNTEEE